MPSTITAAMLFPSSVKQILNFDCNNALEDILLPDNLEFISFKEFFDKFIPNNFIPKSVKTIKLTCWNYKINKDNLPDNLSTLIINDDTNGVIENLPDNLVKLKLLGRFHNSILNNLPILLKVLEIDFLRYELNNLPVTLEKLIIHVCNKNVYDKIKIPFCCHVYIKSII